jgi:ATPase subunit of ABC transporter with duplicated ATPase domains
VLHDVCFSWPDGASVLTHVSTSFSRARTGLVGANGAGKSTLLRLIAGDLAPTHGALSASGTVDYLPQDLTVRAGSTIADLLGISAIRRALRAIESGTADPTSYEIIGQDWDVEERAAAALHALGLPGDLDRLVRTLSGGEAMLVAISGIRLRRADIALLDEPTNNLDHDARERLYDLVRTWRGTLIVVSHDLDLLELMDSTAELRESSLTTHGGPYSTYREIVEAQQDAARQRLVTAEQALRKQQRERARTEQRIAHSERQGRKDRQNRKYVPAAINDRRNAAQRAQGERRTQAAGRVDAARAAVTTAAALVRGEDEIKIDLPDPQVPAGRRIAALLGPDGRGHVVQGRERVALVGRNGVGKTTLLERVLPTLDVRSGYLPQHDDLDPNGSVIDLVAAAAPGVPAATLRNRLARLLVRGAMVDRPIGTLSGGERFRVALARLLLAKPPPQLLVLDEPTNNLDIASIDQLVGTLRAYRGALLVVSHDRRILARLGIDTTLRLEPDGTIRPL